MCKSILEICEVVDGIGSLNMDGTLATRELTVAIVRILRSSSTYATS
jgi:hypothetical protein